MRLQMEEITAFLKKKYKYATDLERLTTKVIDKKNGNCWDVPEMFRRDNTLTAEKLADHIYSCATSTDCHNCIDCYECTRCSTCTSCYKCHSCQNCYGCKDAEYSGYCTDCASRAFSGFSYNCKHA